MKVRKLSVAAQMLILVTVLMIVSDILLGGFLYQRTKSLLITQIKENTKNLARTAAATVDGAAFAALKEGDEDTEAYQEILSELAVFRDNAQVEYVYSTRRNADGKVVYVVDSDPDEPGTVDMEFGDEGDAFKTAMNGEAAANEKPYVDQWGSHLSACAPIFDGDTPVGVVSIDISMSWVNAQLRKVTMFIFAICFGVFVMSMAVLFVLSRMLKKKFTLLDARLSDLTDGSGDLRRKMELHSGDEFEMIANRINVLMEQIRVLVQQVANTSQGIVASGEQLQRTLEDNARTIVDIDDGISSISAHMQECSSTSDTASSSLENTSEKVSAFARQVEETERRTNEANQSANESASLARLHKDKAIGEIEQIQQEVMEAAEGAKVIERVREIAEDIEKIAAKTKILSLNAQIEAARAGEQGRGFAVVASNVEDLSGTIAVSVKEINEITHQALESVERLSVQSATMSEFMTREVVPDYDAFVDIGNAYGETMQEISRSMLELKQGSNEISSIMQEISDSIREINEAVGDSAQQVGLLSGYSSDISDRMQGLTEGSAENLEQSAELNIQIEKYKY